MGTRFIIWHKNHLKHRMKHMNDISRQSILGKEGQWPLMWGASDENHDHLSSMPSESLQAMLEKEGAQVEPGGFLELIDRWGPRGSKAARVCTEREDGGTEVPLRPSAEYWLVHASKVPYSRKMLTQRDRGRSTYNSQRAVDCIVSTSQDMKSPKSMGILHSESVFALVVENNSP